MHVFTIHVMTRASNSYIHFNFFHNQTHRSVTVQPFYNIHTLPNNYSRHQQQFVFIVFFAGH